MGNSACAIQCSHQAVSSIIVYYNLNLSNKDSVCVYIKLNGKNRKTGADSVRIFRIKYRFW